MMDIRKLPGEIHYHGDIMFVHVFDPERGDWSPTMKKRFDAMCEDLRQKLKSKYKRLVDDSKLAPEEADAELIHEVYRTLARELRLTYLRYHQS